MTPQSDQVKVLYLAGKGRSGSTLLASLLGQLPGFFNAAEVNRIWDWGLVENYKCGCGRPVQECPTWHAVLTDADTLLEGSGITPPIASARIDQDQHTVARWPNMLRLLLAKPGVHPHWKQLDRYTAAVSALYRGIASVTGARVIVDSSKIPIEPIALGLIDGVEVHVAQVVRDPRAVVYSWQRSRVFSDRDEVEYLPRFSATFTTTSWLARNVLVEVIGRRQPIEVVSYDDMARDPAAVLRRLADFVGEPAGEMEFLTSATATLAPTHSVGGNPMRMTSGAIEIKPDDEWRTELAPRKRIVTTAIALPLLRRYGLPVRNQAGRASAPQAAPAPEPVSRALPVLTTSAWLRFDSIRHALGVSRPESVLEIGAGEGGLGAWLAQRYDYTGFELDEKSRATAKARVAIEGRGKILDDLSELNGKKFDIVCAFEVLEHISEDSDALKQWADLLKPSGWMLLSVPAHEGQYGAADELVGHYRRYGRSALTSRLHDAGFEVVEFNSYGAGLGHALQTGRNLVAKRVLARRGQEGDTPEERTSGSGRLFQPKSSSVALAFATIAAPGRLAQRPFSRTDFGTGYVVLARRAA
jgi:SAM-dependent methyltransferase